MLRTTRWDGWVFEETAVGFNSGNRSRFGNGFDQERTSRSRSDKVNESTRLFKYKYIRCYSRFRFNSLAYRGLDWRRAFLDNGVTAAVNRFVIYLTLFKGFITTSIKCRELS